METVMSQLRDKLKWIENDWISRLEYYISSGISWLGLGEIVT